MTAAWTTALVGFVSFLLGSVVPFIYKRYTHEGLSVREVPWAAFGPIAVKVGTDELNSGVFGVVKIANGTGEPLLIEELNVSPLGALFKDATNGNARQSLYALDVGRDRAIVFRQPSPIFTVGLHFR